MADSNTKTSASDIFRRKISGTGKKTAINFQPVHRAITYAIKKGADDIFGISVETLSISDKPVSKKGISDLSQDNAVHFSLTGPKGGPGLLVISTELTVAIGELSILGRVSDDPLPDRSPTVSDSALAQIFLDGFLKIFDTALSGVEGEEWTQGHVIRERVEDIHRVGLDLPDIEYRSLKIVVQFGSDKRTGELILILPRVPISAARANLNEQATLSLADWRQSLTDSIDEIQVRLNAVLHRESMKLLDLHALQVGSEIQLRANANETVSLEALDGKRVATAKMGMIGDATALKIRCLGDDPQLEPVDQAEPAVPDVDLSALGIMDTVPDSEAPHAVEAIQDLPEPITADDLPDIGLSQGITAEVQVQDLSSADDLPDLHDDLPELKIAT